MVDDLKRRQETAERQAIRQRNYRRIRDRALARLKKLYPDEYEQLLKEERERDETEGKAWLDLSGRTRLLMDSTNTSSRKGKSAIRQTDRDNLKEGNNGGEA
jgi:broad specificity phosphatase PhoE